MPRFQNTVYKYFNSKKQQLGESDGFLRGLETYPETHYVEKYVDNEFKEKIPVVSCEIAEEVE